MDVEDEDERGRKCNYRILRKLGRRGGIRIHPPA